MPSRSTVSVRVHPTKESPASNQRGSPFGLTTSLWLPLVGDVLSASLTHYGEQKPRSTWTTRESSYFGRTHCVAPNTTH